MYVASFLVTDDSTVDFPFSNLITGLKKTINDEGVWRIRRLPQAPTIEVFKVKETGHGDILSDEFKNWRIKLALKSQEET